jgi:hypothetical protein
VTIANFKKKAGECPQPSSLLREPVWDPRVPVVGFFAAIDLGRQVSVSNGVTGCRGATLRKRFEREEVSVKKE